MASNFTFLRRYWPDLAQLGELAELYLFSDPKNCIFKLGTLGERIAAGILSYEAITVPEGTSPAGLLRLLERNRILPPKIDGLLFAIRKAQNSTIRQSQITVDQAKTLLQAAYHLSCWYMEVYGDGNFAAAPYAEPAGLSGQEDFQGTLQKQEEALAGLPAQVTAGPTAASGIPAEKRRQKCRGVFRNQRRAGASGAVRPAGGELRHSAEQNAPVPDLCDPEHLGYSHPAH